MAQTYAQFKTYIATYLWRSNDSDLSSNLDVLIQQAEDELDKLTRDWQRRQKTVTIAPESEDFNLDTNVADYQAVQAVINNTADSYFTSSKKELQQSTLSHIYSLRAKTSSTRLLPWYGVDKSDGVNYLRFVAPFSASDPGDLTLVYRIALPNYSVDDSSWLEDEYLNMYLNAVLKQCAMFLREDERVSTYASLLKEAFELADMDDKHNLQFGGSPGTVRPHRAIP